MASSTIRAERNLHFDSNTNDLNKAGFAFTASHDGFCTIGINPYGTSGGASVNDTTRSETVWESGYYTSHGTYGTFPIFKGHSYAIGTFDGVTSFRRILYYYND